jgi:hypothetical protein
MAGLAYELYATAGSMDTGDPLEIQPLRPLSNLNRLSVGLGHLLAFLQASSASLSTSPYGYKLKPTLSSSTTFSPFSCTGASFP